MDRDLFGRTPQTLRPDVSRRTLLRASATGLAAAALAGQGRRAFAQEATPTAEITATGDTAPGLAAFDDLMTGLLARFSIPGGQLAIAKDGRLVLNRAYGLADVDRGEPVRTDSLFRIASVTKTITAVAVLELVDDGTLSLDDKAFPLLAMEPPANATPDPRLDEITIRDLLVHAGGWDSGASFDPQYLPWSRMAAATVGLADPAEAATIVRFMLGAPLDFDPGTKSVYSNFGFNVLGRVIEKVSGQPYDAFVRDRVLLPAGITDMRLGRTRLADRAPGEVVYYGPPGQPPRPSVFWGEGMVPVGYGSYYMEALDAHGGWIASAADLVRFATAVDGRRGPALLRPETVTVMETTPRPASGGTGAGNDVTRMGLGWDVREVPGGYEWAHAGALEGSNGSWLFRGASGATLAVVFNSLPQDFGAFFGDALPALKDALGAVTAWPDGDLFTASGAATPAP